MAADDKSSSAAGSAERSSLELVTDRRKILTDSSTLADVANEDVISPQPQTVLVILFAGNVAASSSSPSSMESGRCEGQKIGLTYMDSIPCSLEPAKAPKGSPNVVFLVLDDIGFGGLGCFGGPVGTPNIDRLAANGLSQGEIKSLADNLVIAFATRVIGLVVGGICYAVMVIRTRWYRQDLSDLEYAVDLLRGRRDETA